MNKLKNPLEMLPITGWIGIGAFGVTMGYIAGDALAGRGKLGALVGFLGFIAIAYLALLERNSAQPS